MKTLTDLNVKLFADGADLSDIVAMARNPLIKGFTTNPTLMRKANVDNYKEVIFIGDKESDKKAALTAGIGFITSHYS